MNLRIKHRDGVVDERWDAFPPIGKVKGTTRARVHAKALAGLAALVAVWLSACGNPVGNPDPFIPPAIVVFNGDYTISHTFSVPGTARGSGCTGDAKISSEVGLAFGGTIDIDASGSCSSLPHRFGELLGAIRGPTITFSVVGLHDPLAVIGCSSAGAVGNFKGSFTTRPFGDLTRVQSFGGTVDVRATCDGEPGETMARWEIRASRR
ncbi:MAG: hypothetical protein ACREMD_14300 [Gemmatimonadota bacterium]